MSFKFQVPSSKFQVEEQKLGTWNLELETYQSVCQNFVFNKIKLKFIWRIL